MRRVSVDEAAIALGLSLSSVRRRIKAGTLQVEKEQTPAGFRYAVILPDDVEPPVPSTDYAPPSQAEQVTALEAERDWLRRRVEELTALLNREQEAVLRLSSQVHSQRLLDGLITPTQTPSQPPRRPQRSVAATLRQLLLRFGSRLS